jgi:hypothetical protein
LRRGDIIVAAEKKNDGCGEDDNREDRVKDVECGNGKRIAASEQFPLPKAGK